MQAEARVLPLCPRFATAVFGRDAFEITPDNTHCAPPSRHCSGGAPFFKGILFTVF
jgi:hypothetical protein